MAATLTGSSASAIGWSAARARSAAPTWPIYPTLTASALIVIGLMWDISWHQTVGRDTFWTTPHLLEQFAAALAGLSCGWLVLHTTFAGDADDKAATVRFWGFRGPLGAWICIWGTILMIASAPFDDWWHNAYGLDVQIVSPPHMVLALGMVSIELGALILIVAAENRATDIDARRFTLLYAVAGGILVAMMCTLIQEYAAAPNTMHGALFYEVTAATLPLFFVAFVPAGRSRWPATAAAAVYMAIGLGMMWVLQLFPATPKLAPIYNPVTHMVPPFFPLLLVAPAALIDIVVRRNRGDTRAGGERSNDWALALVIGVIFVTAMVAIHWFWSEFLLSAAARNYFFSADRQWSYFSRVGPWRYVYWPSNQTVALVTLLRGLAVAVILAAVSARVGLLWGKGMARITR